MFSLIDGNIITKKNHNFIKSIYFWEAFESYCFHGHAYNNDKFKSVYEL